jgi:CIC family chloride channel protein
MILDKVALNKFNLKNYPTLNILAVFVGLIAGYGAIGFRVLIGFLQNTLFHNQLDHELISPLEHVRGGWVVLFPPVGILIASLLVWKFAKEAKGHGVPEVIESVLTKGGKIRKRVAAIKALASSITIAAGGSVGREGPIVQIGSAFGSAIGSYFNLSKKQVKILVGCGAAGAIAATFNTPIAGVIFAVELIVRELRAKSFIPLVIASVFATGISRWHTGNHVAFIVPEYTFVHPAEIFFYLGLGILAALTGILTVKFLYGTEEFFEKLPLPFPIKALLGGLIVGGVGYFYPQIFGVGYETIGDVLYQNSVLSTMIILVVLKILMMSVTIGAGGSGGVFAPSLFIGAMLGGAYGFLLNEYFPTISAGYGAYALVGMAAVFASTSRATFTSIVILFEMTMDYSIILPLMFVCVISDQISHIISKDNTIYSIKLKRKGISFINGFGVNILAVTPIKDIMCTKLDVMTDDMTFCEALDYIYNSDHTIYPVVNHNNVLMGMVRAKDVIEASLSMAPDALVTKVMVGTPRAAYPDDTAFSALKKLEKGRDPRIVVVDKDDKSLLGLVGPADFVRLSSAEVEEN